MLPEVEKLQARTKKTPFNINSRARRIRIGDGFSIIIEAPRAMCKEAKNLIIS